MKKFLLIKNKLLTTSLALIGFALNANAALLSIDFTAGTSSVESGFVGQNTNNVIHSTTAGDIQVSFTNGLFFNRGESSSTATSLLDDFVYRNGASTFTMTLSGAGISADTDYSITLWAYDANSSAIQTFTGVSGTSGAAAVSFSTNPKPTSLADYSDTKTFTSDSTGNITIDIVKTNFTSGDGPRLNGIEISAVPEPSTALLSGLGLLALLRRRRR